jgi:chaperonin cofactor prefoldin
MTENELHKRIETMEVHIRALEAENAAKDHYIEELRAAIAALIQPDKAA